MKVLVLVEVGVDVRIPPELDPRTRRVREEWLVRQLDRASQRALTLALSMATADEDVEVSVMHLGPASAERWLRRALAAGAGSAVRVWAEGLVGVGASGKALVLAEAARVAGFDLIFVGALGDVDASGSLGVLLAGHLGVPCVTQAERIVPVDGEPTGVEVTRVLEKGHRERVGAPLPLVVTVAPPLGAQSAPPQSTGAVRLWAEAAEIPVWDLADLGVPPTRVRAAEEALRAGPYAPRRPRRHPVAAPDSSLPAFDRVLKLVEGSVRRREGRIERRPPEQTVEEIFETLRREGWLDHLRPAPAHPGATGDAVG